MSQRSLAQITAPTRHFAVQLSATRRGARLARLLTERQLDEWGEPYEAAAQVVAELASNAVLHGRVRGRDFRLRLALRADRTLRIEVTDARGDGVPRIQAPVEQDAEGGRGLRIVEAYADRWGVAEAPAHGKTVWAELAMISAPRERRPRVRTRRWPGSPS
ncbi:anti-sigma regulatory factor (Ser/Thr protein kinase) [Streptomyces africanus]|uniref:Anti-sigma regulatory factor (Ser/Thr protein kinase) n=1 Tax=Streptomyces africanus TaxID=231024 RepID=A0ABU0QP71_9ACTN|nr:ATP-binding protein [Streptomyces africanus]MDQ0749195.1 anti-sigma regulatory factor (Ser/Thr protein kinase) [Streptomyces africanus]